jgi:LDH2 family malate/lactate/ureidoglycolate dehydrogenase
VTIIDVRRFSPDQLHTFSRRVFESFGISADDARQAADVLLAADLRGIDSHGVARLETYVELLTHGRINPSPDLTIVRETASTATVDADGGLGLAVAPKANAIAMDKADRAGTGWVSVRNSNHYGIAGYYVLQALEREMIGISMTNTSKIVAPLWGKESMLGTNPLAIAFPGNDEPPVVIDMATSTVAFGKVQIAARRGESMPDGWAIDRDGYPTNDPEDVIHGGGAQLPLGSDRLRGGHKGYCLSAMVDILSSVLSGANWGPFAPPFALFQEIPEKSVGEGIGHFFGAMRIDGFIEPDEFKRRIDDWIRTMRSTEPAPGTDGPLIPGDPEREAENDRRANGIPLLRPVIDDLKRIARQTGVPFE